MYYMPMVIKNSFEQWLNLDADQIVWLHELKSGGGGSVICHVRGTEQVEEKPDMLLRKIAEHSPVKFCEFTVDMGAGQPAAKFWINARKIVGFTVVGKKTKVITARGDFEVRQDARTVFGFIRKARA